MSIQRFANIDGCMDPANDWGDWVKADEALARIAELEAENARLRSGGCARDQRTTQFCAEAVSLQTELARLRPLAELYPLAWEECKWHRRTNDECTQQKGCWIYPDARLMPIECLNNHDDARAERGVGQ